LKLLDFILLTQNEILKMNYLCCPLQALLTRLPSAGGFGQGEETQAGFQGEGKAKLHEHGTVPK